MPNSAAPGSVSSVTTHTGPLRSLHNGTFRWLWAAGLMIGFGNWMQRLTISWLVLDQTGSVFLTALSFAIRSAPNLVFGPMGGAIADRYSRRKVLMLTAGLKASIAIGIWLLVLQDDVLIWGLMALVALAGITASFELPASQALAVDVVGRRNAANGVAMLSVASRAVGAAGALTGGLLIESLGASPVFFLGGLAFAIGGFFVSRVVVDQPKQDSSRAGQGIWGLFGNTIGGLKVLFGIPVVATLLAFAMVVEILGFTYQSVMPSLAEDVLGVGAVGLGALTAMAAIGGLAGSVIITALSDYGRKGLLALGIIFIYGAGLIALGVSDIFPLSLLIVFTVGTMASSFDALQWTMLMANVPDDMRGTAMGGWIFAIGFGWAGSLELGVLAEVYSVGWALSVNGIGLLILGFIALFFARGLRRI
ncbi:MAG: MFS transporter [Chloroflexi bacterium]|jgi:MFS family permease|nr:MFS transporter [Chloroflexota bacterium]MBT4074227.1 MFS transporter [Chloroflexota bacterium]MBT4515908.1 MFS transporter [Chloroflexota bacterium]MBT5319161.1 MFS transporter [Chloroflexota bacterium]MBT6682423.1 MFS transporter [Chloroflexota bacterium]